jgi:hypothetical protein
LTGTTREIWDIEVLVARTPPQATLQFINAYGSMPYRSKDQSQDPLASLSHLKDSVFSHGVLQLLVTANTVLSSLIVFTLVI